MRGRVAGGASVHRESQHHGLTPIYGDIYDVTTGRLNEVQEATAAGRAT